MLSIMVVCYLFLGGTGAGACFVLAALGLLTPRDRIFRTVLSSAGKGKRTVFSAAPVYRQLFAPAYVVALGALVLGVVFLFFDLEHADRILLLLFSPTLTYIVVGTYAITLCGLISGALAVMWLTGVRWRRGIVRTLQVLSLITSLVTMVYTGLLLGGLQAVPFWKTWWLPVVFTLSALSCGTATVVGAAHLTGAAKAFSQVMVRLAKADAIVVVLEALAVVGLVAVTLDGLGVEALLSATPPAMEGALGTPTAHAALLSARELVAGQHAWVFWGGVVGAGFVIPLVLDMIAIPRRGNPPALALALAVSALTGGFALRWCIVEAGLHPAIMMVGL